MAKDKTYFVNGREFYVSTDSPVWLHRPGMAAEVHTGKKLPLRDTGFVLRMLDNLQELEEKTRPGSSENAPGKDMAAFKALTTASMLVNHVAGWALDHQRGLAAKELRFVPRVPNQTKTSPAYLERRAAVDTHEHERVGSARREMSPVEARRFILNVLHAIDFQLGFPNEMVEALEALDYGETLPIVEPIKTTRRTGLTIYRAKLTAVAYIEYQYKKGVKKLQSTAEVEEAFVSTRDAIKDWQVELRKVLGNFEVERVLTAARNSGLQYLEERRNDIDGLCPYFEEHYGRPAMMRAAARYRGRSKRGGAKA